MEENERLLELLKYAKEAIDYWFDMCDCSDEDREANDHFKIECSYFINNFKSGKTVIETDETVSVTRNSAMNLKLKTGVPLHECYQSLLLFENNIKQAEEYVKMTHDGIYYKKYGIPFTEQDYMDEVKKKVK